VIKMWTQRSDSAWPLVEQYKEQNNTANV